MSSTLHNSPKTAPLNSDNNNTDAPSAVERYANTDAFAGEFADYRVNSKTNTLADAGKTNKGDSDNMAWTAMPIDCY